MPLNLNTIQRMHSDIEGEQVNHLSIIHNFINYDCRTSLIHLAMYYETPASLKHKQLASFPCRAHAQLFTACFGASYLHKFGAS